ncbi:MAG: hypothetical protein DA328_07440 [Nitrososphaeraceae archaeon]|nr:hypothetical protein [Nitrososphaeraceae archaeon]
MKKRKPVLLIDDGDDSKMVIDLLKKNNIDHLLFDIKNFETSCCGNLPTTKVPSVIAPEGIFKDIEQIKNYIKNYKIIQNNDNEEESSASSYW